MIWIMEVKEREWIQFKGSMGRLGLGWRLDYKRGMESSGVESGEETFFKDKSAPWEVRSTLWQNWVEEEILWVQCENPP